MAVRIVKTADLASEYRTRVRAYRDVAPTFVADATHKNVVREVALEQLLGAVAGVDEVAIDEHEGVVRRVATVANDTLLSVNGNVAMFGRSHGEFTADGDLLKQLEQSVGSEIRFAADPGSGRVIAIESVRPDSTSARVSPRRLFPTIGDLQNSRPEPKPAFPSVQKIKSLHKVLAMQPHIPYLYPANGCWARAEAMCRLLIDYLQIHERLLSKIWISCRADGNCLKVDTNVNPNCRVKWHWHVAPLIEGQFKYYVLDPALSGEPLTRSEWRQLMSVSEASAKFEYSMPARWHIYDKYDVEPSVRPTELVNDLARFRNELSMQIINDGPIPYLACGLS